MMPGPVRSPCEGDEEAPKAEDALGQLMAAAQGGDSRAYEALLCALSGPVRNYVRRRAPWLGNDDLEDLVQEVLISVHSARASYDPARPFMPWLAAIARNRIADHGRRYGRRNEAMRRYGEVSETFSLDEANNSSEDVITAMSIERAMEVLTPAQKEAFRMLRIEELSLKEASERSGVSIAALKVSVHRATRRLRQRLLRKG